MPGIIKSLVFQKNQSFVNRKFIKMTKRDNFNFATVNFLFLSSNKAPTLSDDVYIIILTDNLSVCMLTLYGLH